MIKDNIVVNLEDIKADATEFKKLMLMYNSALKEVETKVNILSDEFQTLYKYNPIEHIKTRIKSPESILSKLERKGFVPNYSNMVNQINDVAGIRIVCSFMPDIYRIADMLAKSDDIKILEVKDYVKNPKPSGYMSYHLIALVPVSFSNGTVDVRVEIQIRTMAMDFWATLEHKIKYKYDNEIPKNVSKDLVACAKAVNKLDLKMSSLGENAMQQLDDSMKEEDNGLDMNIISKIEKVLISSQKNPGENSEASGTI